MRINLNIKRFATPIVFDTLVSTPDGTGASTGHNLQEAFNSNFQITKEKLEQLLSIAEQVVISEQITMLKIDTSTNPYTAYYTMDSPDTPDTDITWYTLNRASFSTISGSPSDNLALSNALNNKADTSALSALSSDVNGIDTRLTAAEGNISTNTSNIGANSSAIRDINTELAGVVHTDNGSILYLKYDTTNSVVYISTNGITWVDINSLNTTWQSITGDPEDNVDLVNYVENAISSAGGDYASSTDFNNHINDYNNPHNVTKAQLGLGNVDNTSDMNKPISTAVQNALDNITVNSIIGVNLTQEDYRDLQNPNETYLYLTSSQFYVATYSITNQLTNVTTNNSAISINDGVDYAAVLTAAEGYFLDTNDISIDCGGTTLVAGTDYTVEYADPSVTQANSVNLDIDSTSITDDLTITATGVSIL